MIFKPLHHTFQPGDRVKLKAGVSIGTVSRIEHHVGFSSAESYDTITVRWDDGHGAALDYAPDKLQPLTRTSTVAWLFPVDVNDLKAELLETARRLGALRQELARRQRATRKAEVEAFAAELAAAVAGGECLPLPVKLKQILSNHYVGLERRTGSRRGMDRRRDGDGLPHIGRRKGNRRQYMADRRKS